MAKHWQCNEDVQNLEDTPWIIKELKKLEEALPRLKECELEEVSRLYKAKIGVGCHGWHPKISLDLTRETVARDRGVLGEGGANWKMAATSVHNDVLLDSEEYHDVRD